MLRPGDKSSIHGPNTSLSTLITSAAHFAFGLDLVYNSDELPVGRIARNRERRDETVTYNDLIYAKEDHIATVTLNRPDRMNALTIKTHMELAQAIEDAKNDDDVRVLIITGAGRGFCSGDDVREIFLAGEGLATGARTRRLGYLEGAVELGGGGGLLHLNKPTIAAVNGAAVGYGCDLALMCDMRIASDNARFGEVFIKVGLVPDQGMLLLPRLVGLAKAYELILTGDIIDAGEAERIGLVNKVVPPEQLEEATKELATKLAKGPPLAVRLAKEGIRRGLGLPLDSFLAFHGPAFQFLAETEDHMEGARAFVEKREPVFRGK